MKKLLRFINQPTLLGEIMRFVLVGGLATVIDFFVMGVVLYICEPSLYPNFFNAFIGGGEPKLFAKILGTAIGFIFGLIANYLLSVLFVFNEKGKSKTVKGFIIFTIFSAIGLAIHVLGMWGLDSVINRDFGFIKEEWFIKIVLTLVVLVYNYLSRRIFIFKKDDNNKQNNAQSETDETGATEVTNE